MRDHIQWGSIPLRPATEEHHRPLGGCRHAHLPSRPEGARRDPGGPGLATATGAVPHDGEVAPRPDDAGPARRLHRVREPRAIQCALAPHEAPCSRGSQSGPWLDQRAMASLRQGPLLALAHLPGQGQRAALRDHGPPEGDTPAPDDTPSDHHDQRLQGHMTQPYRGIGETIHGVGELSVPEPPRIPCDAARGRVAIGHWGGNAGPLRALTTHHTAYACREGGEGPGDWAGGLARRSLCSSVPYGTIPAEVVTHRLLLLDWSHSPEGVYKRGNLFSTHCRMTWQKCPVEKLL